MLRHFRSVLRGMISIVFLSQTASAVPLNSAWVTNSGNDTVSVVSLETQSVLTTINVGDTPTFIAVKPDGSRVYVSNTGSNNVSVIDVLAGSVMQTIPVGTAPRGLTISDDGTRVYVANSGSSNVSIIDTLSNTVQNTVGTSPNPSSLAFHPTRDEVWIGYDSVPTVLQARSATDLAVLATLNTTSRLYASWDLEFRPDGTEVFGDEGCGECGRFHRISGDASDGSIDVLQQDILQGAGYAIGLAINPISDVVYLAKQDGPPRIVEFGGAGRTLTFATQVRDVAVSPDGQWLLVSHQADPGFVSLIDPSSFSVVNTIGVGAFPERIAFAIPEPATLWLMLTGIAAVWVMRRKTRIRG